MLDLCEVMLRMPNSSFTPAQVRQEVDALSAQERAAVMLVCVKGLSYQDAAQKLGISPGMLQEHLLRSRLILIANLKLKG